MIKLFKNGKYIGLKHLENRKRIEEDTPEKLERLLTDFLVKKEGKSPETLEITGNYGNTLEVEIGNRENREYLIVHKSKILDAVWFELDTTDKFLFWFDNRNKNINLEEYLDKEKCYDFVEKYSQKSGKILKSKNPCLVVLEKYGNSIDFLKDFLNEDKVDLDLTRIAKENPGLVLAKYDRKTNPFSDYYIFRVY